MKKMIRFAALFICLVLIFAGVFTASADSVDNEAPVIHSVKIKNHLSFDTYGPNDTLKVEIKATDNIQMQYIYFYIKSVQTEEELLYELHTPKFADEYTIEVPLKYFTSGDYYFSGLWVWDAAGNKAHRELTINDYAFRFSVDNPNYKAGVPIVRSIKITPDKGNSKTTKFTYTAIVEPTGSATITRVSGFCGLDLEPTGKKNEYSVTFTFRDRVESNVKYVDISPLSVNTSDEKVYIFYPEDTEVSWAEYFMEGVKKKDLTVELTDVVVFEDHDLPELKGYKCETEVVYKPDILKVQVTAFDKTSEPIIAGVRIKKVGDPSFSHSGASYYWPPNELVFPEKGNITKVLDVTVEIPKQFENGTYYISQIELMDQLGNHSFYNVEDGTLQKHTFEIKDDIEFDYFTSVTSPDLLDVVGKAANEKGKIVLINITEQNPIIPKAIFEIIAGKDVTVVFEKLYDFDWSSDSSDSGFEWEMYGKHVDKAKAKDINAYVTIVADSWSALSREGKFKNPNGNKYDTFIRINFANNGELPGKATIRFKPGFTMSGWANTYDMKLYYLNESTGKVELIQSNIKTEKTGYFHFNITHNSSYAFVGDYKEGSSGGGGNGGSGNGGSGNGGSGNGGTAENPDGDTAPEGDANSETTESGEGSTTTIGALNTDENTEKGGNALTVVIIVLGALALIGGGVFGYLYYKKRKAKKDEETE